MIGSNSIINEDDVIVIDDNSDNEYTDLKDSSLMKEALTSRKSVKCIDQLSKEKLDGMIKQSCLVEHGVSVNSINSLVCSDLLDLIKDEIKVKCSNGLLEQLISLSTCMNFKFTLLKDTGIIDDQGNEIIGNHYIADLIENKTLDSTFDCLFHYLTNKDYFNKCLELFESILSIYPLELKQIYEYILTFDTLEIDTFVHIIKLNSIYPMSITNIDKHINALIQELLEAINCSNNEIIMKYINCVHLLLLSQCNYPSRMFDISLLQVLISPLLHYCENNKKFVML